jgi:hypothetical protein
MNEDIGSDAHKRPSQPEIKMAVMEERLKEARIRDATILTQLDILIGKMSKIETGMAIGDRRMNEIDKHLESTDTSLEALKKSVEDDKRSPLAIVLATISALGAGAVAWFK